MIHPGLPGGGENAKTFQRKIWIVLLRGAEEELVAAVVGNPTAYRSHL